MKKEKYSRQEVERILDNAFLSEEALTGKQFLNKYYPKKLEMFTDEFEFLQRMKWYDNNLSLNDSIIACKDEIKSVNKNVKKRSQLISLMESSEDKNILTKDFFSNVEIIDEFHQQDIDSLERLEKFKDLIPQKFKSKKNSVVETPLTKETFYLEVSDNEEWLEEGEMLAITAWRKDKHFVVDDHIIGKFPELLTLKMDEVQEGMFISYDDLSKQQLVEKLVELGFEAKVK